MKFFKPSGDRDGLLYTLSVCGILAAREHPGFDVRFIPETERTLPSQRFVYLGYPVCWWRAADGVNDEALGQFLPQLS